jgi:polynucleotide 5'-hydroxyl-kinase GRC3/NOL9
MSERYQAAAGKILLLQGPATIDLRAGRVEIVGYEHRAPARFRVPRGKKIPCEFLEAGEIVFDPESGRAGASWLPERTISPAWEAVVRRVIDEEMRKVLILGEMDTGKSFFATYLSNRLKAAGKLPGVLDCDLGQSDIGPSGALGLLITREPVLNLQDLPPTHMQFVGTHSPGQIIAQFLLGVFHLFRQGLAEADVVIVNTTGWVAGDGGRLTKAAKIELIDPDLIVLMQRGDEVEHLVLGIPPERVARLTVNLARTHTSQADRRSLREESICNHLCDVSRIQRVALDRVICKGSFFGTGKPIEPPECSVKLLWAERLAGYEGHLLIAAEPLTRREERDLAGELSHLGAVKICSIHELRGLQVGLCDAGGDCLAVGILYDIDFAARELLVIHPLESSERVRIVHFGLARYTMDLKEDGFLPPGRF